MADPVRKPIRIRKLLGWGVTGQVTYVLSQFVLLFGLTRFATIEDVGFFGLASSIAVPIVFFFQLGAQVNAAASRNAGFAFSDFKRLILLSLGAGYLVLAAFGWGLLTGTAFSILLIFGAAKTVECYSGFCYGILQRHDRMDLVAKSLVLRGVTAATLFVAILALGGPIELAFIGHLVVLTAMAVLLDHRRARREAAASGDVEPASWTRIGALLRSSLPLGANNSLANVQGNAPRYAIVWLFDLTALGYFTVVAYAMQAMSTVTMAATQSMIARFNFYIAEGKRQALYRTLAKYFVLVTGIILVSVAAAVIVGDQILQAVFGPDYGGLGTLLAICVFAAGIRSVVQVLEACLVAARRFRVLVLIRLGSALLAVPTCVAGGMIGGLNGVAVGLCVGLILHGAGLAIALSRQIWTPAAPQHTDRPRAPQHTDRPRAPQPDGQGAAAP